MKKLLIILLLVPTGGMAARKQKSSFRLGIENVSLRAINTLVPGGARRVGLVTNQTGRDQEGKRSVDILRAHNIPLAYLFAPEHGLEGTLGAGEVVKDAMDKMTGIPIISLYGHGSGRQMPKKYMDEIDLLIVDLQDSGMRHYTYISTLMYVLKSAAQYNKPVVVLDRPNPLGGRMEGPLVDKNQRSFISIASIPVRHGMTMGELAEYFNRYELEKAALLHVVKMSGFHRNQHAPAGLLTFLSPGIRTHQSCYGYSFLGLLGEIRPFAIGLRTPDPFQCIMLPESIPFSLGQWDEVSALLAEYGVASEPHNYVSKTTGTPFVGLKLHFEQINDVSSFKLFISLLDLFKKSGVLLNFSKEFDIAVGTSLVREWYYDRLSLNQLMLHIQGQMRDFYQRVSHLLLYEPKPQLGIW